jgi:hypothetical protein
MTLASANAHLAPLAGDRGVAKDEGDLRRGSSIITAYPKQEATAIVVVTSARVQYLTHAQSVQRTRPYRFSHLAVSPSVGRQSASQSPARSRVEMLWSDTMLHSDAAG